MRTHREHGGCSALSTLQNSAFHLCTPTGPRAVRHWGKPSCRSISQYPRGSSGHGRHTRGLLVPVKAIPGSEADSQQGGATPQQPEFLPHGSSLPSQRGCEHPGSLPGNIPACPSCSKAVSTSGVLHALAQRTPGKPSSAPEMPSEGPFLTARGWCCSPQELRQDRHCQLRHSHTAFLSALQKPPADFAPTSYFSYGMKTVVG